MVRVEAAPPAREAWKKARWGRCAVCGRRGRLVRHHVVYQQHVRAEGGNEWALSNSMNLGAGCLCHTRHHSGFRRIPIDLVPREALGFAIRLFGEERAPSYFQRFYAPPRQQQEAA